MAFVDGVAKTARSSRRLILATVLTVALLASSCGGSSREAASEPAAPSDSAEATTTTAAAESSSATSAAAVEPDDTVTAADDPAPSGEGFAVANGTAFNADTTPDEAAVMINDIVGDTSDFAAGVARLVPFPAVSIPADATVLMLAMAVNQAPDGAISQSLNLLLDTSVSTDDASSSFLQQLMALGWEVDGSVATSGDVRVSLFETPGRDGGKPPIVIFASYEGVGSEALALFDGFGAAVPAFEGARINGGTVQYDELGGVSLKVSQTTEVVSGTELHETLDQRAVDLGWVFIGRRPLDHHEALFDLQFGADFAGSPRAVAAFETPGDSTQAGITLTSANPADFDPTDPFGSGDTEFAELYYAGN